MPIAINYFGLPGRAEATRVALAYAGKRFDDNILSMDEYAACKWAGKGLPVLEVDGTEFYQSMAMLRYAGRLGGIYPDDPLVALRVDEIVGIAEDVMNNMFKTFGAKDDTIAKEVLAGKVKILLELLIAKIAANPSSSKFCVGDTLTTADLQVLAMIMTVEANFLPGIPASLISDSYASLMEQKAAVMADPKVQAYYASKQA